MRILLVLGFICLLPFLSLSQDLYFHPNNPASWETTDPASLGYCQPKIDSFYTYLESAQSKAFILLKDGKIVLESYFGTFTQDSMWYWASAGKTLTAALVGLAQQEGLLDIQDQTSKYLGAGWSSLTPEQEANITIWHQLTMTTGLDDGVSNSDCTQPACLAYLADPGTRWAYHNGPYTLLDNVLQAATNTSLNLFLFSRLRNIIGMDGGYVKTGDNTVHFSTARAMARFGLWLLAEGRWGQTLILTDTAYLRAMTQTSQELNKSYGYLTWLNGKASYMAPQLQLVFPGPMNPAAPADAYAALGKNGQLLNIVPSEGMVWIRIGHAPPNVTGLVPATLNDEIWQRINGLACLATTVDPAGLDAAVKLVPNPAAKDLRIQAPELIQRVRILTTWGQQVVERRKATKEMQLDIQSLSPGMYVVEVSLASGVYRKMIMKQ